MWNDHVLRTPDRVWSVDAEQGTRLTFREADDLSGRVYAFLKRAGIGREDFVLIRLPRGILTFTAALGVMKAGAAYEITEPGKIGEICLYLPFFRGYRNLPDVTAEVLQEGRFMTGDLAYLLPDGDFVLAGRSNDMIKINGNRIEPAEIEAAGREALGVQWCAAKGFVTERRSFIVL